jgi:hypothetical protein
VAMVEMLVRKMVADVYNLFALRITVSEDKIFVSRKMHFEQNFPHNYFQP